MFKRAEERLARALKEAGLPAPACNPDCKKAGSFIVAVDGKPLLSLTGLKRPFKPLRETDLDDLAARLVRAAQ